MNWLIIFSTFPPHLHLKEMRLEQQLVKLVLEGDKLSSNIRAALFYFQCESHSHLVPSDAVYYCCLLPGGP